MPVQVSTRRPVALVVAIAASSTMAGACAGRSGDSRSSPHLPTYRAVCSAADRAESGDVAGARRVFTDAAHEPLHRLAEEAAAAGKRPAAALLLEAKESVERAPDASPPVLAETLAALAVATGSAMEAVGAPDPGPCRR